MLKCPVCNREYEGNRQLHGHMLKAHQEEYKKYGNRVANMIEGKKPIESDRPEGFRLLNKSVDFEAVAYKEGYRYRCKDYFYTSDEVKEKGWI